MSILLVDDDMSERITISIALRERGFQVDLAEDGIEALHKIRQRPYDWVISDIRMPRMSGIDLLKEVKKLRPECKIVMISAYNFPQESEEIEVARHFEKPVDIDGLCDLLKGSAEARETYR